MKNKKYLDILTLILFILSSLFMYNFYKALSGFIANGFRDFLVMFPIIISYLLLVISFLTYFYDRYINNINKISRIIFSSLMSILSIINLVLIFNNINIYISNNKLGGYDTLLGLIKFPYDSIICLIVVLIFLIIHLVNIIKPIDKFNELKVLFNEENSVKLNIIEYVLICIYAILVFVFIGSFINGLKALSNILYDVKYIYLLLWVLIPLINLIYLVFKFENKDISKKNKVILLTSNIGINILFGLLLLVFELIYPSFIVQIGKPIFTIAFSVSLPIEMLVLLILQLISIIICSIKLIITLKKKIV